MLDLKVLGTVSLQGSPVSAEARQKRRIALLAIVAVSGEKGISRERLQTFLWPESPAIKARHALDQLIYATRRALGEDPFLSEGGELRLDCEKIQTDVRCFKEALKDRRLEDAVSAYGGPLLDGFHVADCRELETWTDNERLHFESEYHAALETLANDASKAGDTIAANRWWLRRYSSDPLSSRVAAETIRSYLAAGDTSGAIQLGRAHQQLIRKELEIEPDPAIEKLISNLPRAKSHDEPVRGKAGATVPVVNIADATPHRRSRRKMVLVATGIVAMAIVAVAGLLERAHGEGPVHRPSRTNPEAMALYLRGVNAWNDRSKASLDTAVIDFRKSLDSEPDFAEAEAGLANAYVMIGYSGYRSAGAMFPKAKAAALHAIQLDSTLAAPYAALGMELTWERKFPEAEAAYKKALALDPGYATGHQWYGILLMITSRTGEAVAETRRAAELDPLSLQVQNNYASFLSNSGQSQAALQHYQKVVGDEPDSAWVRRNPWLLTNMASVYAANKQFDKALRFAQRAVQILPGHPRAVDALANVYYRMGLKEDAERAFAQADTSNEHYPAYRALLYVTEGKPDSAFAWFDRVHEWGIPILIGMPGLRHSPVLRNDPRLPQLFRRIGLPFVPLS